MCVRGRAAGARGALPASLPLSSRGARDGARGDPTQGCTAAARREAGARFPRRRHLRALERRAGRASPACVERFPALLSGREKAEGACFLPGRKAFMRLAPSQPFSS